MDKNQNAVALFDKNADLYQNKYMDVSLYAESLDFFCSRLVTENASILELASGPGNLCKYILSRNTKFNLLGSDLSERMIELAQINNPNAQFIVMDCRNILQLNKKFDAILCGFAFPYLNKEEVIKLIADSSLILDSKGVIYISTMEDDYKNSGFQKGSTGEEIFIHYHQSDYLNEAFIKNGFKLIYSHRIESIMTNGIKVIDLIIIAQKE